MSYMSTKETKKYNHDRLELRCSNQRRNLTELNNKISHLYSLLSRSSQILEAISNIIKDSGKEDEYGDLQCLLVEIKMMLKE